MLLDNQSNSYIHICTHYFKLIILLSGKQRKPSKDTDVVSMLIKKQTTEAAQRQAELQLQKERLNFDKQKFEAEQREREDRFKLEREERMSMINLLSKIITPK